jgi:EAL and modified HD-GYP domain-containing signal transduction protein
MPVPYLFFHPILAADRSWIALDWQSGSPWTTAGSDFVDCFSESGAAPLASLLPLIAPVNPAWLEESGFVDGFDAHQLIFVLPAPSLEDAQVLARCKKLRAQGKRFGLRVDRADLVHHVPPTFDYLSLDAAHARQDIPQAELIWAKEAGFRKIATRVDSHEMFAWLSDKGFDWYDSHFLTAHHPHFGKEPDLTRLKLLKLLNLVKHDGDTRAIEAIFREEPKLSYNLLRLVNSVAVGARSRISNFSQAIALLGRRQLQRWLQLLIYADNLAHGHAPNPLMQLAAARGRQMELLAAGIEPRPAITDLCDNAFLTGLFSLLDILIDLPMQEILKELPLHDVVMEALSSPGHGGLFGQLLSAITAGETGNFSAAEAIFANLGISPANHAKAQVSAFYWAARINIEHQDD